MKNSLLIFILTTTLFYSQSIYVSRVIDGDTFYSNGGKYRLAEIDAPELSQTFGVESKMYLKRLIENKMVYVDVLNTDKYGRLIVRVYLNGIYISQKMVENGYAWQYSRYSKSVILCHLEQTAKNNKKGLWKYNYINPQKHRKYEYKRKIT